MTPNILSVRLEKRPINCLEFFVSCTKTVNASPQLTAFGDGSLVAGSLPPPRSTSS